MWCILQIEMFKPELNNADQLISLPGSTFPTNGVG